MRCNRSHGRPSSRTGAAGQNRWPAVLSLCAALAGCSNKNDRVELEPVQRVDDRGWGAPETAPMDGYVLLSGQPTQGVFPSAVAVARLTPGVSASSMNNSESVWSVSSLPNEQATYWNTLMTHVPEVREVIVLDAESIERPGVQINRLLQSAGRRGAGLCLAYGVTSDDPQAYRMGGVLFDTASRQKLAVVRAEAGPGDYQPRPPDRHKTDLRHEDPSYLCARKMQAHLRDCLLDLIARDTPANARPNPWQGTPPQQAPSTEVIIVPAR